MLIGIALLLLCPDGATTATAAAPSAPATEESSSPSPTGAAVADLAASMAERQAEADASPTARKWFQVHGLINIPGLTLRIDPRNSGSDGGTAFDYFLEYIHDITKSAPGEYNLEYWVRSEGFINGDSDETPDSQSHEFRLTGNYTRREAVGKPDPLQAAEFDRVTWERKMYLKDLKGEGTAAKYIERVREQKGKAEAERQATLLAEDEKKLVVALDAHAKWETGSDMDDRQHSFGGGLTFDSKTLLDSLVKGGGKAVTQVLDAPFTLTRGKLWNAELTESEQDPALPVRLYLGYDSVAGANTADRATVTDDDSFSRLAAAASWKTLGFKGVEAAVSWKGFYELGAPQAVRDAHLARSSYVEASVSLALDKDAKTRIEIQYTSGRLPPSLVRDTQLTIGLSGNF
jgi:hypothetical protein